MYFKKMRPSDKLKEKSLTIYQMIAQKHGVSAKFVGMIARQERNVKRGKGLLVKLEIETMINSQAI